MEKLTSIICIKKIPIPDKASYFIKLIEKIESVTKKLRWKALLF